MNKDGDLEIYLQRNYFVEKEKTILKFGELKAVLFRYDTGVNAVRIENQKGYIIILPYNGQMIWDAVFNERSLKMQTQFEKPKNASHFLESYGCFLMYCGARRVGCPSKEETYPLHGDLPFADYEETSIIAGEGEKGKFIGLTGRYEYNMGFGDRYEAKPLAKLYENNSLIDIEMTITNLVNTPMELMFMYHPNYFPNGRIVQACSWDQNDVQVRITIPKHVGNFKEGYFDFLKTLKEKPEISRVIKEEHIYDPEVVFHMYNLKTDKDGNTHFMQVLDDGSGNYVKYNPKILNRSIRWFSITPNQQTFGLALPATCEVDGYLAEKKKGNIRIIPPKGKFYAPLQLGYIDSNDVSEMEKYINNLK